MRAIVSLAVLGTSLIASCGAPQGTRRSPDVISTTPQGERPSTTALVPSGTYTCGDPVLVDQVTSGGEELTTSVPCWDTDEETEHAAREAGDVELVRAQATYRGELAAAQLVHCKGIPERELTHSPLAHRKSIEEVIPHRSGPEVAGARIVFKPVPGLTASWMKKAIACHQARHAALGRPASYLPEDPTLVEGADVRVTQNGNRIEVLVTTPEPAQARVALERANGLLRPKTATR